jgi:hypothetical protein
MDMHVRRASLIVAIVTMILAPALPASSAVTTIGLWRFEEGVANTVATGTGSILDSSGSGDNGTPSGGPIYRADVPPSGTAGALSLQIDGDDDQVAFSSMFPFHLPGDAMLDFWVRYTGDHHQSVFWSRFGGEDRNRFNIFVNGNGTFGFDYRSPSGVLHKLVGEANKGIPIPFNTWTHLVITRSGTHYSLYVNGGLVATADDASPDLPTFVGWTISGNDDRFQGLVDEVRFSGGGSISSNDLQIGVFKGPQDARTLAYANGGDLTSGGYATDPSTGTPTSLDGTGTIPSTVSGDATVTFHVAFDDVALRWSGTAVIDDPGGGFTATIPVHSGRHGIRRNGTVVSGTLWGIKAQSVPQKCFMIAFAIDQG